MARWVRVLNASRGGVELARVLWCDSFACRLRGLMFRRPLENHSGLLLVERRESRTGTSIHMAFVRFSIGVAWLDGAGRVVGCRVAAPWKVYAPPRPARFVLETSVDLVERVDVGEVVEFVDATMA
jgi:uncharacterized membrane protein (UPF0127 family)